LRLHEDYHRSGLQVQACVAGVDLNDERGESFGLPELPFDRWAFLNWNATAGKVLCSYL
jgi:hypothetical protein